MLRGKPLFSIPIGILVMVSAAFASIQIHQFSSAAAPAKVGKIQVTSYAYDGGSLSRVGNTTIHTQSESHSTSDTAHNCNPYKGVTNTDKSNAAGYGQVHFSNCWANTGTKSYTLSFVDPPSGYKCRSIHWPGGSSDGCSGAKFDVKSGSETAVEVWLDPPPKAVSPQPQPRPQTSKDPDPGSIQVTTYIYGKNDNDLTRIGNTEVHVQAVDFATTDVKHNCNPYNLTTNSNKNDKVNYGQAHFPGCWSASTGTKAYQFSLISPPVGYTFRSIHSPNLRSDGYFEVHSGQETAVSIWLNAPGESGGATKDPGTSGSSGGGTAPNGGTAAPTQRQVVGSREITGQVISRNPNGSTAGRSGSAIIDGAAGSPDLGDDNIPDTGDLSIDGGDGDLGGDTVDEQPPSVPGQLKATEESAGAVHLSWQVSGDNDEVSGYTVERSVNGSAFEVLDDSVTDTDYIDVATAYSQRYSYRVSAQDITGNNSDSATTEITIKPFVANAPAAAKAPTDIRSSDGHASLELPAGASRVNLDCGLVVDNQTGQDLLTGYGNVQAGPYQTVCKNADGDTIDNFDQSIDVSVDVENDDSLNDDSDGFDSDALGFDGNDWTGAGLDSLADAGSTSAIESATASKIKKGKVTTYHLKSKKPLLFAVASKASKPPNTAPLIITIVVILIGLTLASGWAWKRYFSPKIITSEVGQGPDPDPDTYIAGSMGSYPDHRKKPRT